MQKPTVTMTFDPQSLETYSDRLRLKINICANFGAPPSTLPAGILHYVT